MRRTALVSVVALAATLLLPSPASGAPGLTSVIYDGNLVMTVTGSGWLAVDADSLLGGDIHFAPTPELDAFGSLANIAFTHVVTVEEGIAGVAQFEVPLSESGRWYVQIYVYGDGPLAICGGLMDCSSNVLSVRNVVPNGEPTDGVVIDDDGQAPPERTAGENRYSTAAAISRLGWATSPVVYLATGQAFADALAAGPAAAYEQAPILLVDRDTVPDITTEELQRLAPDRLVIVGGTAAVSAELEVALDDFIDVVDRVAGLNRYETAAAIAQYAFDDNILTAYVASGRAFPDPIIAGAAAALVGTPLLLVDGTVPLEASVRDQLTRLEVTNIVTVGPDADLAAALPGLRAIAPVTSVNQPDVYERSAAMWDDVEAPVFEVILATANAYADALTGTPYAARAPVSYLMLSEQACVPDPVLDQIDRLAPERIMLLGGTAALTAAVGDRQPCA